LQQIPVWENVDFNTFHNDIMVRNKPAHIKSVVGEWPAVKAGMESPESIANYLKAQDREKVISALVGDPSINGRFFYRPGLEELNFQKAQVTVGIGVERLIKIKDDRDPFAIALQAIPIAQVLPNFKAQNPQPLLDTSVEPTMWLGNRAIVAPHYDIHDNLACVVAGRRKFNLFPPEQIENLYPGPTLVTPGGVPVSMVDINQPDMKTYPKYAEALKVGQEAILEPGDAIYIPALWWHGVESLESINVLVNYWWGGETQNRVSPNDSLIHAMLSIGGLSCEKREAWHNYFNYYVFKTNADPAEHLPADLKDVLTSLTPEQNLEIREFLIKQLT
jgi:mannose-6-phosphate isomerase-like protein (cupin superfamily)